MGGGGLWFPVLAVCAWPRVPTACLGFLPCLGLIVHPLLPLPAGEASSHGLGSRLWGYFTAWTRLSPCLATPHWHWLKEPSEVTSGLSRQCYLSLQPPEGTGRYNGYQKGQNPL